MTNVYPLPDGQQYFLLPNGKIIGVNPEEQPILYTIDPEKGLVAVTISLGEEADD